jgi:hypothetical protein
MPPPLNQEGGDAAAPRVRPHVAPPASADQGSGRAIQAEELLAPHKTNLFSGAFGKAWDGILSEVNDALASEYSRGQAAGRAEAGRWKRHYGDLMALRAQHIGEATAAGRLSGIEEAARFLGEIAEKLARRPEWTVAELLALINEVPIRQRALTPGGTTAEVDPNAWAFKHGLEST